MSFLPAFGRLDVASRCVFPWTSRIRWPKQPPNKFLGFGRAISEAAECFTAWGDAPLDAIAERNELTPADARKFRECSAHIGELLAEEALTDRWRRAEVTLAYHVLSREAREPKREHARDYSDQRPDELSGTPDLVRCRADGAIVIRDYKTGRYKRGARPRHTPQLRALGLAAARAYGVHSVVVELVQVDEDGAVPVSDDLDPFELAVVAGELEDIYRRIEGHPPPGSPPPISEPRPGYWCDECYCPLVGACPATERTLAAIAQASELKFPMTADIQSDEHAAWLLERLGAAETALEHIAHAVKERARRNGPIPLANGKHYGVVLNDGREAIDLSVAGAAELVERHLGPFAARVAVEMKTSKSALTAAAKAQQTRRGEGVNKVEELLDALRGIGAVKRGSPFETFDQFVRDDD